MTLVQLIFAHRPRTNSPEDAECVVYGRPFPGVDARGERLAGFAPGLDRIAPLNVGPVADSKDLVGPPFCEV